jgi:hypothetical protein
MSQIKIDRLTPEQFALIPVYIKKWEKIALSTERIDRQKATEAIKDVYAEINLKDPKMIFCNSPHDTANTFAKVKNCLGDSVTSSIFCVIPGQLRDSIWHQIKTLGSIIKNEICKREALLKIVRNIDVKPIHLLKMTCPSTNHVHALRVPPNLQTAREAIRWVNWDIDPEEFSIQT